MATDKAKAIGDQVSQLTGLPALGAMVEILDEIPSAVFLGVWERLEALWKHRTEREALAAGAEVIDAELDAEEKAATEK